MCLANALAPFGSMRGQLMGPREEKKKRMLKVAHVIKSLQLPDARGVEASPRPNEIQKPLAAASRFRVRTRHCVWKEREWNKQHREHEVHTQLIHAHLRPMYRRTGGALVQLEMKKTGKPKTLAANAFRRID